MNKIFIAVIFSLVAIFLLTSLNSNSLNYAYAHSLPVTETPAPNSIIKKGMPIPTQITIDFSERPDPNVSTIQVLNAMNQRVDNNNFIIIGDHNREAKTTLKSHKLTDGVYTVSWMTQSIDDGHIARGSYVFGIGNVGPGGASGGSSNIGTSLNQQRIQTVAVTSNLDGLIKWPLIVSQVAIVGGIFSHLFLWEMFGSKIYKKNSSKGLNETKFKTTLPWIRRFSIVLLSASVAIIASGSSSLFLQVTELAANSNSSYWSIFRSVLHGSTGLSWLLYIVTSSIIIICVLINYYVLRKKRDDESSKKSKFPASKSFLLYFAFVAGAVSILASSIASHNAAVNFIPSLAVFIDWLHLMAVSLWVGGLFYISTVLLSSLKRSEISHPQLISPKNAKMNQSSKDEIKRVTDTSNKNTIDSMTYYLAILLPRFSLIATLSLGIVGISGIYMAWIELHTLNALFYSPYGNVLIIKLAVALPLVLLGAYHQTKIHGFIVMITNIGKVGARISSPKEENGKNTGESKQIVQTLKDDDKKTKVQKLINLIARNKKNDYSGLANNNNDETIFSRFGYTLRIESLLALAVLLVASILSVTSPNSMSMASMSDMSHSGSTAPSSHMAMTGSQMQMKNSTYVKQVNIMNVNTKIEINPFYSGFNTFKITFTDPNGKPYAKVTGAELIFKNEKADIGPIVVTMHKIQPNIFTVGAFIGLPGEWNVAMAAQRQGDYDLNYAFTSKITNAPHQASNTNMKMASSEL